MSLLLRVNIALIVVFAVGITVAGMACRSLLERNARHEVRADAELMMDGALAARSSCSRHARETSGVRQLRAGGS
jgi:hypothetical protein